MFQKSSPPQPQLQLYRYHGTTVSRTVPAQSRRRFTFGWRLRLSAVAVVVVMLAGLNIHAKLVAAQNESLQRAHAASLAAAKVKDDDFKHQITDLMAANPTIRLGVAVQSSMLGLTQVGDSGSYDAASTAKLITAMSYLHRVELGKAQLHQKIDGQDAETLLRAMIVDSDDAAWNSLNGYLTHAALGSYGRSLGLTDYDPDAGTLPPADMATVLKKLYEGHALSAANRSLLLSFMKIANYRQFIVAGVSRNDQVYHKIGLDNDAVNDVAIIQSGSKQIELVIFSDGAGQFNWPHRATIMQAITQAAVKDYLD